ncbi:phage/plasmid replication protein [Pseudomonas aeruginosa]|uniref:phage/plasmid replication domain-containing protein n=1 Tax=Pseudomonas aeruginosa TaxID=287 RepID=UPI0021B36311|nr:phage/plasmid replication protein [Pseudomonas aeruginosa]MCT7418431.1 phage/plasmid replication protein [Pseudomonas aeruginosa]
MLWKQGHDISNLVARLLIIVIRQVLLGYGIDINIRCDRRDDSNVVPMIRILEAKPAAIPNFFFERGLIHKSARQAAV